MRHTVQGRRADGASHPQAPRVRPRKTVDRFALGWKTNPLNPAAYASTLAAALAGAVAFKPSPATQWLKQFYSMENFKRHWMLRLRQRMGLPAEELVLWAAAPPG